MAEISIRDLLLYNDDQDTDFSLAAHASKQAIADVDAVLFVTPEYSCSIPGALKNAIHSAKRTWMSSQQPPHSNGWIAALTWRTGAPIGRGNIQLDWTSPVRRSQPLGLRWYAQLFSGYGETLLHYNHRQTSFGAGLTLFQF